MKHRKKQKKKPFPWDDIEAVQNLVKERIGDLWHSTGDFDKKKLDSFGFNFKRKEWEKQNREVITFAVYSTHSSSDSNAYDIIWPECQVIFIGNDPAQVVKDQAPDLTVKIFKGFKLTREHAEIPKESRVEYYAKTNT